MAKSWKQKGTTLVETSDDSSFVIECGTEERASYLHDTLTAFSGKSWDPDEFGEDDFSGVQYGLDLVCRTAEEALPAQVAGELVEALQSAIPTDSGDSPYDSTLFVQDRFDRMAKAIRNGC